MIVLGYDGSEDARAAIEHAGSHRNRDAPELTPAASQS
jgi:hypothetical protein